MTVGRSPSTFLRLSLAALAAAGIAGLDGARAGLSNRAPEQRGCPVEEVPLSGVVVVRCAEALEEALDSWEPSSEGSERRVIMVPDRVRIDLGEINLPLEIKDRVTLRSDRGARRLGAFLHLDDYDDRVAFRITGSGVIVRDLRLRGPSPSIDDSHDVITAIRVGTDLTATISGNEIYEWPGIAVAVQGTDEGETCRQRSEPVSVRIERNYIHHNQRNSFGYGVVVTDGGFAVIEGNTFDWNRHAIAGDGTRGSGYIARGNYVLSGGSKYSGSLGFSHYNQHFDMHGTGDGGDGGIAGDYVGISGNTFHGAQHYGGVAGIAQQTRPAYWLRGMPCRAHAFHGNVLVHDDDAIRLNQLAIGRISIAGNRFDTDTSWDIGVGDFDGDGRDDLFQPTGAAWYYSSSGITEWRLLQSDRDESIGELRFGDFDGDGKSDVFTATDGVWRVSDGGTAPWRRLNTSAVPLNALRFGDFDGDGKTDVFRASGSRWYYSRGGAGPWDPLAASQFRVEDIRFGDFDGNGRTDVFGIVGDRWSASYNGLSRWQPLSPLKSDLASLVFADFDGNGRTDVARSRELGDLRIEWLISYNGLGAWRVARAFTRVSSQDEHAHLESHWLGRFDASPGIDALRYEVRSLLPFGILLEGPGLIRSSGARARYIPSGRNGMR